MKLNINYTVFLIVILLLSFNFHSFSQFSDKDKEKLNKYLVSAKEYQKNDENKKAANQYYKAGRFCLNKGENKKAIPYFKESYKIYGQIKDFQNVMKIYSNLGLLHANLDQNDKALLYFQKSLKIRKNLGDKSQISSGLLDYAYVLAIKEDYKNAIKNTIRALDIANEIQNPKLLLISYRMLAENYQKIGNEQKAAEYLDKFASYRQHFKDTKTKELVTEERIKSIAELSIKDAEAKTKQLEYELMKKNKEFIEDTLNRAIEIQRAMIKAKNDSIARVEAIVEQEKMKNELVKAELNRDKAQQRLTLIIFSSIVAFGLLIALVLLFNIKRRKQHNKMLSITNQKIAEQNKKIEIKNEELTSAFMKIESQNYDINSSINYAVNIQRALLPPQRNLNKYIDNSFVFFKPRDKVSGDFYWFKNIVIENGEDEPIEKTFVSTIDCTGHGVPGAFLSIMSYNLLENIIEQKKIYEPAKILDELHEGVRKSLRQDTSDNRDGMDMSMCCYDKKNNILEFAGAKNPLIYIKDNKLERIKGDIKPIGGVIFDKTETKRFTNYSIEIDEPITVYIFSDGFADQTGEETGRKLMSKFFRNLLFEIHKKPMENQRDILKLFLQKWQGNVDQTDDIILIGFKLFPNNI